MTAVIKVKIQNQNETDDLRLEVSVNDDGIGIDESDINKIFEPFSMTRSSKNRELNPQGNGVGLSICKMICKNLEGDINVSSLPKQGSKFTFSMKVFYSN